MNQHYCLKPCNKHVLQQTKHCRVILAGTISQHIPITWLMRPGTVVETFIKFIVPVRKDVHPVSGATAQSWDIGEWGREAFNFTGNSCHVIPAKPSRIGLWMYRLVAQSGNGQSVLIHMRMLALEQCVVSEPPKKSEHGRTLFWGFHTVSCRYLTGITFLLIV